MSIITRVGRKSYTHETLLQGWPNPNHICNIAGLPKSKPDASDLETLCTSHASHDMQPLIEELQENQIVGTCPHTHLYMGSLIRIKKIMLRHIVKWVIRIAPVAIVDERIYPLTHAMDYERSS